jgi:hypothetical protein
MLSHRRKRIMDELKTLKDIREYCRDKEIPFQTSLLKQEAIKWVKNLKENKDCDLDIQFYSDQQRTAIKHWIKTFFNLPEEDITKLKETTNGK